MVKGRRLVDLGADGGIGKEDTKEQGKTRRREDEADREIEETTR